MPVTRAPQATPGAASGLREPDALHQARLGGRPRTAGSRVADYRRTLPGEAVPASGHGQLVIRSVSANNDRDSGLTDRRNVYDKLHVHPEPETVSKALRTGLIL